MTAMFRPWPPYSGWDPLKFQRWKNWGEIVIAFTLWIALECFLLTLLYGTSSCNPCNSSTGSNVSSRWALVSFDSIKPLQHQARPRSDLAQPLVNHHQSNSNPAIKRLNRPASKTGSDDTVSINRNAGRRASTSSFPTSGRRNATPPREQQQQPLGSGYGHSRHNRRHRPLAHPESAVPRQDHERQPSSDHDPGSLKETWLARHSSQQPPACPDWRITLPFSLPLFTIKSQALTQSPSLINPVSSCPPSHMSLRPERHRRTAPAPRCSGDQEGVPAAPTESSDDGMLQVTCLGRKPVPPTLTPPSVKATSQKQTAHPSSHVFPRREDWRKAAKQEYGTTTTGQSERRKCKEALLRQALTWRTAPSEKYLKYLLRFDDALDRAPKREMALAEVERDWVRYEVYVAERTLRDDRMPTTIYGTEDRFELDLLKLWVNTNQHRIPSRRPWPPDYQPRHLWSRRRDTMNAESSVALDSMYTSDVRETEAVDARSGLLSWFFG